MKNSAPLEIERKFLICFPDEAWLASQPGSRCVKLTQTYLCSDGTGSRRVRSWTENGETVYFKTCKRELTERTRIEEESRVTETEFHALLQEKDPKRRVIEKTRWILPFDNHDLEIDLYPFWTRQAVLECELQSEDEAFSIPSALHVLREVTGDRRYLNSSLAFSVPEEDEQDTADPAT